MGKLSGEDRAENARRRQTAGHELATRMAEAEGKAEWLEVLTGVRMQAGRAVQNLIEVRTSTK